MKKFKINSYQAAKIAFWVSLLEYLLYFAAYWTVCDTSPVAGLTVSYQGYVLCNSRGLESLDTRMIFLVKNQPGTPFQFPVGNSQGFLLA